MNPEKHIPQIAILINTIGDWGKVIAKGVLSYATEAGPWRIWLYPNDTMELRRLSRSMQLDGIIAEVSSESMAREVQASGVPVVNVSDATIPGFSSPCVRSDDDANIQMAIDHYLQRGFSHVAFAGNLSPTSAQWYANTFLKKAENYHLSVSSFSDELSSPARAQKMKRWLAALPKPVGILTWGHNTAREILYCCMEDEIPVPHDVSVLNGHYDDLYCRACSPALSGIRAPTKQIGYYAAKLLNEMLQGKEVPHTNTYFSPLGIHENLSTETLAVKDPQLKQVVEFIQKHALEDITILDILKVVPMARRSLDRRFFKVFGRTPAEEIRRLRINKARQLLAESDFSMQRIAESCGFSTYNYLTLFFKKMTGMSPSEYRNKYRAFRP